MLSSELGEKDPKVCKTILNLAVLYQHRGQLDEAIECYQRLCEIDPTRELELIILIATLHIDQGQFSEAIAVLDKITKVDSNSIKQVEKLARVQSLTGLSYHKLGNLSKALEMYTLALETKDKAASCCNCNVPVK